jgi:hypothetical protein
MKRALLATAAAAVVMLVPASPALADDTRCVGFLPPATYDNIVVPEGQFCFPVVRGNAKSLERSRFFSVNNVIRGNLEADKSERVFFTGNTTTTSDVAGNRTVGGNVHVKELRGNPGESFNIGICNLAVGGDLIVEDARGARVEIGSKLPNCAQGNDVEGNLQVFKNRLSSQQVAGRFFDDMSVFNNRVGGEVQVFENVSPTPNNPQNVERNRVEGNMQVFKNQGPEADKRVVNNTIGENLQCKENDEPFVGQPNIVGGNAEDQCGRPSS